ncbi:gamma-butyrobetaine hydroxylase-like domain-containing protein [Methylovirgula sp. 4M-Z18]|uniref:gamma-butyrobetaine hydroxylase-like domain-containing protein n=1 Tax=Methylovirgula sp. 4M-Z18 TaxID=2293567 RepID=UPI000E2F1722|nr:DUF971 domain-containing protein [Methylovirgula sp. 4M-Z18]RFB80575.1 DUF971 domain-containing protein [Methylovirgula sp. 4M-Z18]
MQQGADHWPTEIRVREHGSVLKIQFIGGEDYELSAEYLRVSSPSAEVRGHSPAEKKTVAGKRQVRITQVTPVGNYAARLVFDDGHDSGLYTWDYLFDLGQNFAAHWQIYLDELEAKHLNRG